MRKNIRDVRTQKGYSQADVAKALGIKPNTYSQYETGKRKITLETAFKLKKIFDCSLDDLVEEN